MMFRLLLVWAALYLMAVPQAQAETLRVDGVERTYTLVLPRRAQTGSKAPPLMVVLHGGGGNGARVRGSLGLDAIADRDGFAVAYPDGLGGHWNDGRPSTGRDGGADDVKFLEALVSDLAGKGVINPDRVSVAGISNGGMMAYRLACGGSTRFQAYAALIANLSVDLVQACKAQARPMLMLAGTADKIVPYGGGTVPFGKRGTVISADETGAYWLKANGCTGWSSAERLPDADPQDGSTVDVLRGASCAAKADAAFYRINGGGHTVPSTTQPRRPLLERLTGPTNRDFDAVEAVATFLLKAR